MVFNKLIIFIKNPVLGKVKTRISATMGNSAAYEIYSKLLHKTRQITEKIIVEKYLYYSDYIDTEDAWPNSIYSKQVQKGNDLGERMSDAFQAVFQMEHNLADVRVILIGSDCAELSSDIIEEAFLFLESNDVVLGPAVDGGYYLVGMNQSHPELFENISWSTENVLEETLKVIGHNKLKYSLLPVLHDIDSEEDWLRYCHSENIPEQ